MELARNLKVECVSRLQPGPALCMGPSDSLGEAVARMRRGRVGCVLVCEGPRLVGIFTERDLLRRALAPGSSLESPLSECMTPKPKTVQFDDSIWTAVRLMEEGGYRHLPVVDKSGRPTGVLSVKKIVHYVVEHFPSTIYCLPPDPNVYPLRPEGA